MQQTVIVTGAERGLGLALVQAFLQSGARVIATRNGSDDNLRRLQDSQGQSLTIVPMDVTDPASIRAGVTSVAAVVTSVDILINNAGVHLEDKHTLLEELDFGDQHLETTMAVNAFGPLRVTQRFLPLLDKGAGKTIINISSEAGSIGDAWRKGEYAYCMSKAALNMQTKLLCNYLAPKGYRVLAIHPGWMRTDMGGPEADIAAQEAAAGVLELATGEEASDRGIYLDYRGKSLQW